ncbi:hypothetical protein ACJD0Z_04185 [Flavobacteriaceae bacterium M23B6Z8]
MFERGLIDKNQELCTVTEYGYEIYKSGSWLEFLKIEAEKEKAKQEENKKSMLLEQKIKILQKESLEYQKQIRTLEEQIKVSTLLKNYWWLIIAALVAGTAIASLA